MGRLLRPSKPGAVVRESERLWTNTEGMIPLAASPGGMLGYHRTDAYLQSIVRLIESGADHVPYR